MRLFISYRRADNAEFVERIRDWLLHRYGRENVFMDFDAIPPFVKFADYIRARLQESDAVIVIVGPRWLELLREKAAAGEDDFVRIEIEEALALGKRIAPICIKGGMMPRRGDVPESLRGLCDYNAASLDSGRGFYEGIERIVGALEAGPANAPPAGGTAPAVLPRTAISLSPKTEAELKAMFDFEPAATKPDAADDADALFAAAAARHEAGDYAGAVSAYTQYILRNPADAVAYNNRGYARRMLNDFDGAIADYTRSIGLDNPSLYQPYWNRGLTHQANNALDAAAADFYKSLELGHPEPWLVYYDLGMTHSHAGDLDGALREYSRALELKPDYAEAFNNRGGVHMALGDTDKAIEDFTASIRCQNEDPPIPLVNRARVYMRVGEWAKAITDLEAALALKPDDRAVQEELAEAQAKRSAAQGDVKDLL